jgi:hypothetical protein
LLIDWFGTRARAQAVAASVVAMALAGSARAESIKFEIGGYGEMLYSHYNYGPDQKSDPNGSPPDSRAILDIPRLVLEFETYFTRSLWMEAEVEYEHGGTGSAMELEYEEFGEFEFESEKGGEVVLEEFHLTRSFGPTFNARLGHFVVPVGLVNGAHMPTDYFGSVRPESEVALIPTTWHETGAEVFGTAGGFAYRAQVVNGLDATGFGSQNWITAGHQGRFEQVQATDLAFVGRLDYVGVAGIMIGASGYYGNSTQNRPKPDMEGIDGHVTIGEAHASVNRGALIARGMALYGTLENADVISQRNGMLPNALDAPRTPVAKAAMLWYVEAGYDVLSFLAPDSELRLFPFGRYEYYNSMEDVDTGVFADPRFERHLTTAGLNLFLTSRIVLKADYSHRTFGDETLNDEDTVSIALGFSGTFFEHEADGEESPEEAP